MRISEKDIGTYTSAYLAYSSDRLLRKNAASGAVVTQILLNLLRDKVVDMAVVSRLVMPEGKITAEVIATDSPADIISAQTSIYFDFDLLRPLINHISKDKKYAVVMLPCQVTAFRAYCEKNALDRDNFVLIALFCGHATDRKLLDLYLKNKQIAEDKIKKFNFRVGHWRGKTRIRMNSGQVITYPAMHYNIFQNLFFFTKQRCLSCMDHYGKNADISCGDAWLSRLKSSLIKHSLIIARTDKMEKLLNSYLGNSLTGQMTGSMDLLKAQKRSVIYHSYNLAGRYKLRKIFGVQISYDGTNLAQWNDIIGAFFILLNYKLSYTKFGQKLMFSIPKPLLFAYAIFIKVFLNF